MKSFPVAGGRSVSLALFSDVSNTRYAVFSPLTIASATVRAARPGLCAWLTISGERTHRELLELMQSGSGTLEPEAAFINASLVPDVLPVLAAAHKALLSKSREALTTRTLHSDLVYNYSGSKHITESLKRCGIADDTRYVLAARFDASDEEVRKLCILHAPSVSLLHAIYIPYPTTEFEFVASQMKAVEKLISGTEIDLSELETRADQPKILKQYKITTQELSISTVPEAIVCRIAARDAL
ncbi:hypothetical protein ACQ4PT_014343 [Festuca glaucescens]